MKFFDWIRQIYLGVDSPELEYHRCDMITHGGTRCKHTSAYIMNVAGTRRHVCPTHYRVLARIRR